MLHEERIQCGLLPSLFLFLAFHWPCLPKVIYTTNAIESLNMSLRKIIKMRGSFPNDEAAFKLLYLALRNASKKWTIGARVERALPLQNWHDALNRFSILWVERMPKLENV